MGRYRYSLWPFNTPGHALAIWKKVGIFPLSLTSFNYCVLASSGSVAQHRLRGGVSLSRMPSWVLTQQKMTPDLLSVCCSVELAAIQMACRDSSLGWVAETLPLPYVQAAN